ncbi:MAG TPA: hypothetical protein VHH36_01280 [Candidatus Thermoplasmatota archaeon]|nr:hypothetical protein [Candidatus Thermoplasmatota archaeon]
MRLAVLLSAAVLLSGCAALRDRIEAPPVPEFSQTIPWSMAGCRYLVAVAPADPALFAERIPEGFRVLPLGEIDGFPEQDTRAPGNLGVEAFRCERAAGYDATANGTLHAGANASDVSYGAVFAFVEPPAHLRDANVSYHFLKFDTLVADPALRALLAAEGIDALPGNATFSRYQDVGPAARLVQARLDMGGAAYAFSASTAQPTGPGLSFVEWSVGAHGLTRWHANVTAAQATAGAGVLDLSEATWVKDVLGTRAQAYDLSGTADLVGTIAIPGRP